MTTYKKSQDTVENYRASCKKSTGRHIEMSKSTGTEEPNQENQWQQVSILCGVGKDSLGNLRPFSLPQTGRLNLLLRNMPSLFLKDLGELHTDLLKIHDTLVEVRGCCPSLLVLLFLSCGSCTLINLPQTILWSHGHRWRVTRHPG